MSAEPLHDARTLLSRTVVVERADAAVPLVRRADRRAVDSLAGRVDLSGDWDSSATNAEIAADFTWARSPVPLNRA